MPVTTVAVWQTGHVLDPLESLHREEETGASIQWYQLGELTGLVVNGKITCGITLASLALMQASGCMVNLA